MDHILVFATFVRKHYETYEVQVHFVCFFIPFYIFALFCHSTLKSEVAWQALLPA